METDFDSKLYLPIIITIDGTAASGKGTLTRGLKANLDSRYRVIDAGLMYRALTYFYIKQDINSTKLREIPNLERKLMDEFNVNINENDLIVLNGEVLHEDSLKGPSIDPHVANFSDIDEVKKYLVNRQKEIIRQDNYGWILDGRCMGTAVAPHAQVKFYVDADIVARASRRQMDYAKKGRTGYSGREILLDLERRDKKDRDARIAPFKRPEDAIEINSFDYSPEQAVHLAMTRIKHILDEVGKF